MTITAALVALVYAVVEAPQAGWGDVQTLGLLALAAVLTVVFVGIESRSVAPLAPLGVFRSRSLVGGNLVLFALGTMGFGVPFILTQYAQEVLGWSPIQFGLASVVMPVTAVIGTSAAQAIATKGGVRRVAVVAMVLTGLGSLLLTQVSVGGSYLGDLFLALLLLGPGIGAAYVAGSIASLTGVAETEAGLASGLNNASFQIGGAVGVAIMSTVAVSGAHGADPLAALTNGYQSAFAVAIAVAALGCWRASLLLGRTPRARAQGRCRSHAGRRLGTDNETRRNVMQLNMPPIVSPQEWQAAWEELLVKEKELTRARDALAAERRRMPRMAVEKDYRFEGPDGPASLLDLFEGRRQLIVYRFFYEPGVAGWPAERLPGCSMVADQVAHLAHLNARDTTLAFVSRAPQPDIERWKARMGWEQIPWYTLTDDFDEDFGVDEWHGTTPSSATATGSSAPTSSTSAATRRWATP